MIKKGIRIIEVVCILCFSFVVAGQEQKGTLKINYEVVDQQLKDIFKDLENKYDIRFSYSTESIISKRKSCDFKDLELGDVLDYLIGDEELEYKRVGNNILLRKNEGYVEEQNNRYQKSIHLKGKVVFEDNQEQLSYASVSIENSSIGTFTDEQGHFDLEIPSQYLNDSLVIHYIGLEDQVFLIRDLKEEYILIPLSVGDFTVEEVLIVNRKKKIRILDQENALSMELRDNPQSGILGNDLTRNLQKLAGVSASDDSSAEIKIRGSHADETLIILDEMPIYNCNHFYGVFNSINTNYVEEILLYKSFFPFEYGGKTGGIVKLSSDQEISATNYVDIEVDLMTAATKARVKLADNLSLTLAGRGTIRNISNTQFNSFANDTELEDVSVQSFSESVENNRSNPSFQFYDLNAKLQWRLTDHQSLSVSAFNSFDAYDNSFRRTITENNSNKELMLEADENEEWKNTCSSITHKIDFDNKWQLSSTGIFSSYMSEGNVDYVVRKPPKEQGGNNSDILIGLEQENEIKDVGFKSILSLPFANHTFKIGTELINHKIIYNFKDNNDQKIRGNNRVNDMSVFALGDCNFLKKVNIKAGLRSTYFQGTDKLYHSPRILLAYKLQESLKFRSSFGMYQQFIREFPFEYRGTPKKLWVAAGQNDIPVLESKNWMIGISKVFYHFGINVELYYKDYKGLTEFLILDPGRGNEEEGPGLRDYSLFTGDGFTRGVDVMLNSTYKNYDTYLSYTLSESKERFDEIGMNQYFDAEDDRRHQVKWINSYKWKQLHLGLDYVYLSGRRYTDLQNLGSSGNITDSNSKDRFQRVDPYNRFDISLGYDFTLLGHSNRFSFSVLNVFNSDNNKYIQNVSEDVNQSSESTNVIVGNESALLQRTFNVSWRMEFGKW